MPEIVYSKPVEFVSFKIFGLFDAFRNNSKLNNLEDSVQITLLLVSLYKDRIIDESSFSNDLEVEVLKKLVIKSNLNNENKETYLLILDALSDSLSKVFSQSLTYLSFLLFQIENELLVKHFPSVVDDVIYRIAHAHGRTSGEFIQPVELTRFMNGLANLNIDSKVYNPFAGLASFGIDLNQDQNYFGQELNQRIWALGALRLMAYNRPVNLSYRCEDSILNWPDSSKKYDLIISNPPYGTRLDNIYKEIAVQYRTIEHFLIENGVQSLKQEGKLIALLPQGFLFRGMQEHRLRESLIENDLIDSIISLPAGLLLNTGIPLTILVINKSKAQPGKVKFIDATRFVSHVDSRLKVLDDTKLITVINNEIIDNDIIRIIDNQQIRSNDYNLSVARYFQEQINGVKLKDIIEPFRGQRSNLPEVGKLMRIRDLKDDNVDFTLDESAIGDSDINRNMIYQIDESCLLLAMRWKTLKPTYFEFKGNPIFKNLDIFSAKVDESKVYIAYLINELQSEYVQKQLDAYRLGGTIPSIRQNDLLEVVIKLPSLEEQKAKIQGIYELANKIKVLQEERNALVHGKAIKDFNEFASLKHTLGRPRQNILDWSDNLLDFINRNQSGFEEMNKAFIEFYEVDMVSVLKEIKRDVNFITEVLEKGENGLVLSAYDKQLISLSDINSVINELSSNGFNFKIKKLLLKSENTRKRGILANKTLLKTLLDNLLTNANKYAFDKKEAGNEVVIELNDVDDFLVVEIKNNGKPFPKNFDREKYIAKYSTADKSTGSGLGGYDIHRIASDFDNPDWILTLNDDPLYPVEFKFQFPIKLIN
ncbi:N-6 DNA methylase [Flavobacterium notoginsengisoli]|uniref:N-6 DNA methylase n=1 Tax=Flavobacterium notoginsengisoli TaxID=1478199 RepID=UPI00362C608E